MDSQHKPIPEGFRQPAIFEEYEKTFDAAISPFYYREVAAGYEFGLWIEQRHSNVRGAAHGGFMTAYSDIVCGLATLFHRGEGEPSFVTVSMSYQFIGAVPIGSWLSSLVKIRKAGRSTIFVDCEHSVGADLVGASQAVMKTTRSSEVGKASSLKPDV